MFASMVHTDMKSNETWAEKWLAQQLRALSIFSMGHTFNS